MSITLLDSRALLRFALAAIALALGLGRAAVASEVTTPVEQLHAGLMAIMKAGKTAPFRQRYDMIASVIGQTFDLEVILRQVIGPRLAALPPDQRAAVGDAFRRYTIASYVASFDTYSGQHFEVAPVARAAGSDRVVGPDRRRVRSRVCSGLCHAAGEWRMEGGGRTGGRRHQPGGGSTIRNALHAGRQQRRRVARRPATENR